MSDWHYTTAAQVLAEEEGRAFIAANLAACIRDMLEGQQAGIIPLGKLVDARVIYQSGYGRHSVDMADKEVKRQAMQAYLDRAEDAAMLDWVIRNRNMRVQGSDVTRWFVLDCKNGLTFYVDEQPTYRDAIRAAMEKQAAE